jgi:hypothetical protein
MRLKSFILPFVVSVASAAALEMPATTEVGIYLADGAKWREAPVEVLSWKHGRNVTGKVRGNASPVSYSRYSSIDILIHAEEGKVADDYQLVRLHTEADARELRADRGGTGLDPVPFKAKLVSAGVWSVELRSLPDGQYGFISPATKENRTTPGKIYSFDVGAPMPKSATVKNFILGRDPAFRF